MYRKNAWEKYDEAALNEVMAFNEGYKKALEDLEIFIKAMGV